MLGPNGAGKSTINEMILGLVNRMPARSGLRRDPVHAVRPGPVGAMLQAGALLRRPRPRTCCG